MKWISRPVVSCSARYVRTLRMSSASCGRYWSSQKTAGVAEARARVTASLTQSRTAASFTRHARQMSPCSTVWAMRMLPAASTMRMVPEAFAWKVLSWLPYSSAACAMRPTFGTLPMVRGSSAPFSRQKSITAW